MITCDELASKVVRQLTIFEDGAYGPEVHIAFTDGTSFCACMRTSVSIEAKHIHDEGGEPRILHDYSSQFVSRGSGT